MEFRESREECYLRCCIVLDFAEEGEEVRIGVFGMGEVEVDLEIVV